MTTYRISFQLYSARKFPPIEAHLEALAAIGYDSVEPYGAIVDPNPEVLRKKMDAVGLACPSAHVPLAMLDKDRAHAIAVSQALGLEYVIMPHIAADERPADAAGWTALGQRLSGHAAALAEAGLKFAWHNHAFEFDTLADGSRPIDHLIGAAGVNWEPDIGWVVRAGADARAEIAKFPGKAVAFHMKDVRANGSTEEDGWADVGHGAIDWQDLWPAIAGSGADLLVVEHDNPADWRRSAARSFEFVTKLVGAGSN